LIHRLILAGGKTIYYSFLREISIV